MFFGSPQSVTMGSVSCTTSGKSECKMKRATGHCCLEDCFKEESNYAQLQYISNIEWYFSKTHEKVLRQVLNEYHLDDITTVIMQYLDTYKSSQNNYDIDGNYRAYIRSSLSLLNNDDIDNNAVCSHWLKHSIVDIDIWGMRNKLGHGIKCIMLGSGAVGKSCLVMRFVFDSFSEEYDPTIEDDYTKTFPLNVDREDIDKFVAEPDHPLNKYDYYNKKTFDELINDAMYLKYKDEDDRVEITMDILDSSLSSWNLPNYYWREPRIFFLVFDVMFQRTFDEMCQTYQEVIGKKVPDWNETHNDTDMCFIAVGNKCDLRDKPGFWEKVDMEKANKWFEEKKIPYIETSAKNGKNVNFLFRHSVYEYWIQSHSGCIPDFHRIIV